MQSNSRPCYSHSSLSNASTYIRYGPVNFHELGYRLRTSMANEIIAQCNVKLLQMAFNRLFTFKASDRYFAPASPILLDLKSA